MRYERAAASLLASLLSLVLWSCGLDTSQEAVSGGDLKEEFRCMQECVPTCIESGGESASCQQSCGQHCGTISRLELKDLKRFLPKLKDLTGVVGTSCTLCSAAGTGACATAPPPATS